jgi:hypothetical protein
VKHQLTSVSTWLEYQHKCLLLSSGSYFPTLAGNSESTVFSEGGATVTFSFWKESDVPDLSYGDVGDNGDNRVSGTGALVKVTGPATGIDMDAGYPDINDASSQPILAQCTRRTHTMIKRQSA